MKGENAANGYARIAKVLHWLTAATMLPALAIAIYFDTLSADVEGDPAKYFAVMPWHKTLGFLVLLIVAIRLPYAVRNPKPQPPATMASWQMSLAHAAHWSLYGLMVLLPLLGWLGTSAGRTTFKLFGQIPMPYLPIAKDQNLADFYNDVHVALGWTAVILVVVHIAAALWHQFHLRDGLLRRML